MKKFPRSRAAGGVILACGLAVTVSSLVGCAGSDVTSEQVSQAKEKMDVMKSATEWQTAHQAFLAGDLNKATKHIEQSLTLNPEIPKSHVLRGRIQLEQGQIDEAFKSFARASELDATNAEAPYYTGITFERVGQPEQALEQYQRASDLDPENAQYAIASAEMLIDMGNVDDAETYLTQRQAQFEHNAGVRQTLGHIATMRGDDETAVSLFEEARLLAPDDASITEDLVRSQIAIGQFADAEFNLAKLAQDPEFAARRDLQHLRVQSLVSLDRLLDAREIAINLTEGDEGQNDTQAWIDLGNIAFMLNDTLRTKQAAARVIALAPDRPEGYVMQGLYHRSQGDLKLAKSSFERAISIQRDSDTLVMLGIVQRDLNQIKLAQRSFQQALEQNPSDETAQQLLAEVSGDGSSGE